jgi:hypothetical protein
MLDEIGAAISGYLAGCESVRYRTIGLTSLAVGVLFFSLAFIQELLFSDQPMTTKDVIVLAGFALFISAFTLSVLLFAKRRGVHHANETNK